MDWVDVAKGLCIILVVMMHATAGVEHEAGRPGFLHEFVAFAKPFRMPDFFLLSGLFLYRVIDRDWRAYADKRVVHFAYFYVLWLVIQSVLKAGPAGGGTLADLPRFLLVGLVEPYSTLWFVYALAMFSVATKVLRPAPPAATVALAATLNILSIDTGSFIVDAFCQNWVYFLVGATCAKTLFAIAHWAGQHAFAALAGLAAWAVANGALAFTTVDLAGAQTLAELPGVELAAGLAGATAITVLAAVLARLPSGEALRYAGERSIVIYLTFFLPMAAVREGLVATGAIEDPGLGAAIATVAAVLVPLAIERLVRGTRLSFLYERPSWARLSSPVAPARLQPAE